MSSREAIGAIGGDPFCRFFALLGVVPHTVADDPAAARIARELADAGETGLLLVEEPFTGAVVAALGEDPPVTVCALPGPAGGADASGGVIDGILTSAIGSHLHES